MLFCCSLKFMMYQRTSHVVKPGALQHPLQKACEQLMRHSPELHQIHVRLHQQARVMGKKTPALIDAGLVEWAKKNGIYSRLASMVSEFKKSEAEARDGVGRLTLSPPRSSELYERIEPKADIVDVGVGDGKRLVRYAGYFGKVYGVDSVKKDMVVGWPKAWSVEIAAFNGSELTITSFLSFTQLPVEIRMRMEECDGLHVVPDHRALKKFGVVELLPDRRVKCDMGGVVFEEYDLDGIGGETLREYYKGYNTYKKRDLNFTMQGRSANLKPNGNRMFVRMQRDLFIQEFTPKYNGTFLQLRVIAGKWMMTDNIGRGVFGLCNAPDMVLNLESLKSRYVLLRVEKYKDYRPYHSLDMLEKFCARVKIKIMDKHVVPPERIKELKNWQAEFPEADGIVCRTHGLDYLMNCGVHLDLYGRDKEELNLYLVKSEGAKDVIHSGPQLMEKEIYEVCVKIADGGGAICAWKRRKDKLTVDDSKVWPNKFKLLSVEKYLLKFEKGNYRGGMCWDLDDGTD